jgi:hypothetical protein
MNNKHLYFLWSILTAVLLYFNVTNNIKLSRCEHEKNNSEASNYVMFYNINHTSEVINSYNENKDILRYVFLKQVDLPVLIYRYQQGICSSCFQEDLSALYQLQGETGKDRILILPAYECTVMTSCLCSIFGSHKLLNASVNLFQDTTLYRT